MFYYFSWIHLTSAEELCTTGDDIETGQHGELTILVASNWQVAWQLQKSDPWGLSWWVFPQGGPYLKVHA